MAFNVIDLGLLDFTPAWEFQKKILNETKAGIRAATLILCQHRPVITMGRQGKLSNIVASAEELATRTIKVISLERGGDVTYHGPGQLTIYPIINLSYFKKDIHWYLRCLEQITINVLKELKIRAGRRDGLTGVWIGDEKIASIGIAIKHWITFHGITINVKHNDLENFRLIRPCGMDIRMTSIEDVLISRMDIATIKQLFINHFSLFEGHPIVQSVGYPQNAEEI
ncbi:MAG: lipoyl(octanoyl) transferase LipB [Candidatus Omnitrophica bacterium]|nr:lipoyl(octanoyl) transferase LipB [Candidatus Omnitrophota bacterium]